MFETINTRHPLSGRRPSRRAWTVLFSLTVSVAIAGFASPAFAGAESNPNLVKLENKFFQHDFAKEDDLNTRLERLEKMIFGETRTGDPEERLKNLVAAVPNLNAPAPAQQNNVASGNNDESGNGTSPAPARTARKPAAPTPPEEIADASQYPAVTAIEKKLLGRAYSNEAVGQRLARLETKVFGKPSTSDDLSDRLDRLKDRTGVDVAKNPPAGSDWADDDDRPTGGGDVTYYPPTTPYTNNGYTRGGTYGAGGAGSSSTAMGGYSAGGSGSYGMGGSSRRPADGYQAGGTYGGSGAPRKIASAGNPVGGGYPKPAPDVVRGAAGAGPAPAMGLSDTIAALETELFGKTFHGETIPNRLNRLETTVFPNQHPSNDMAMPDRVRRLTDAVPISNGPRIAARNASPVPSAAQDPAQPDADGMPPVAPQRSGLSKILSGLGNLISGGGMSAYPVGSNLVQDPQTGLLWDRFTGNLIDPNTGVVVGNRVSGATMGGVGMGGLPMGAAPMGGGYGGFNNGLSPLGTPYGMGAGSGMRFGFGGSGIRFGSGSGMGMGMWP